MAAADEEDFRAIHDIWFALSDRDKFRFIENNIQIQNNKGQLIPLTLTEGQRRWFADGPLFHDFLNTTKFWNRICLKCRNAGASYVLIGTEAVMSCWVYPNIFVPFVSATEPQANDLIKYCKRVIKNAAFQIPLLMPMENQTQSTLQFANNSVIRSFAGGNPDGIRGPRSMLSYIDEFAFVQKPQEVLSAIEYFHTEGGQLNVLSTPWGKQNPFWRIWSDRDNFVGWKRHLISLFKDMKNFDINIPIPKQIAEKGLVLSSPWLNIDFLEKKRLEDQPFNYANFAQEMVGLPMDEVTAAISESVLDTNKMEYYYYEQRPIGHAGMLDTGREYILGMDFGADVNMTAAVILEAVDDRFIVCYTEAFKGEFEDQIRKVSDLVRRFNPKYILTDATGMGGKNWSDLLTGSLGDNVVIPINYAKKDISEQAGVDLPNKSYLVANAVKLLSQGLVIVPKNHRRLRDEILGLQKLVYEKTIRYSGKSGPAGADDMCFAFLQGVLAYDKIFSLDQGDKIGMVLDQLRRDKDRKHQPLIRKAEYVEAASSSQPKIRRIEEVRGFSKLI